MAIEVVEQHKSRPGTHDAENPKLDILYLVTGTTDEFEMDAAVDATAPTIWGPNGELNRQGWDWTQPENAGMWYVTVHYDGRDPKTTGVQSVVLDNSGGTQHITVSKGTVFRGGLFGEEVPDHKGSIGVTGTGIDGVDIPFPKPELTVEVLELVDGIEEDFIKKCNDAMGQTNNTEVHFFWHGQEFFFDIGEMLNTSFQPQYRGNGTWSFIWKFAISPNVENLYIGGSEGVDGFFSGGIDVGFKYGHDYLWCMFREGTNAGSFTRQPKAAYIEQVYDETDFNELIFDRGWF